jgi:hypothetical protein
MEVTKELKKVEVKKPDNYKARLIYTKYRSKICIIIFNPLPLHGETAPSGPGAAHYRGFTITLRHTHPR